MAWSELWRGALGAFDRRLKLSIDVAGETITWKSLEGRFDEKAVVVAGGARLRERERAGLSVQADPLHRAVPAGRQLGPDRAARLRRAWPRRWASRWWSRTARRRRHDRRRHRAKAPPDGYTIGLARPARCPRTSTLPEHAVPPEKDLAPVTMLAMIPFFLVAHPSQPARLKELIASGEGKARDARRRLRRQRLDDAPRGRAVQHDGRRKAPAGALQGQRTGVDRRARRTGAARRSRRALAIAHVRAARCARSRSPSKRASSAAPEVPTFEEAGVPGYEAIGWFGTVAPASTPPAIIQRLNRETVAALQDPQIRERALAAGAEPFTNTPQEFAALIREETRKWAEVIRTANIKLQ
jgi:hypothetical protein